MEVTELLDMANCNVEKMWKAIEDDYIKHGNWGRKTLVMPQVAEYIDQMIKQAFEEKPMTPNERLLKAVKADIAMFNKINPKGRWRNGDGPWCPIYLELEAAVKECEEAEATPLVSDHPCGCPIDSPVHTKHCRKAAGMPTPVIETTERIHKDEMYRRIDSGYYRVSDPERERLGLLTDQQRRLGLRSTRHVTPGEGNWDYD